MEYRKTHTQTVSAAKAGLSERTARRIDSRAHQPVAKKRAWRTRPDPLANVWEPIVAPLLSQIPGLPTIDIFEHLCEFHADKFRRHPVIELQSDLDDWLQEYNYHRTHQGKMCCGRTPIETLEDGKRIWKEKFVG